MGQAGQSMVPITHWEKCWALIKLIVFFFFITSTGVFSCLTHTPQFQIAYSYTYAYMFCILPITSAIHSDYIIQYILQVEQNQDQAILGVTVTQIRLLLWPLAKMNCPPLI